MYHLVTLLRPEKARPNLIEQKKRKQEEEEEEEACLTDTDMLHPCTLKS